MVDKNQSEFIEIGRVLKAVGLNGLCSIELYGNTLADAEFPFTVLLGTDPGNANRCVIEYLEQRNKFFVCQFQGIEDRDGVEALRNLSVFIEQQHLPELQHDEFYHFELKGMEIFSENNELLGVVEEVHNFPSTDALEVRLNDRSLVMMPFRAGSVIRVERKGRRIIVNKEFLEELL
jgi:16S rRNA processing protein RimM